VNPLPEILIIGLPPSKVVQQKNFNFNSASSPFFQCLSVWHLETPEVNVQGGVGET